MTQKVFYETYHDKIVEIMKKFQLLEGRRIGRILESGNHYQIIEEHENIDLLSECRMILLAETNIDKPKEP